MGEAIPGGRREMPANRSQLEDVRVIARHWRQVALGERDALLRALDVAAAEHLDGARRVAWRPQDRARSKGRPRG